MPQAQVISATPAQQRQLQTQTRQLEQQARTVTRAVVSRFAFWSTLRAMASSYGVDPAQVVGAELVAENERADQAAREWAAIVKALDTRTAELAAWQIPGDPELRIGVVVAGSMPTHLQAWPLVPIIVVAAGAVLAVGTWVLADFYLSMRDTEAQAQLLAAKNQTAITQAVTAASRVNPQAAAALADALAKANAAASSAAQKPAGIIDQLANAVTSAASSVASSTLMGVPTWLVIAGLWWWSTRKERRHA